jgi:hypothetical protein
MHIGGQYLRLYKISSFRVDQEEKQSKRTGIVDSSILDSIQKALVNTTLQSPEPDGRFERGIYLRIMPTQNLLDRVRKGIELAACCMMAARVASYEIT